MFVHAQPAQNRKSITNYLLGVTAIASGIDGKGKGMHICDNNIADPLIM